MSTNQQTDRRARADAHFKAREILRADADQARHDYYAAQAALAERTQRLRKERLARETERRCAPAPAKARALRR
jgi:hypothetical protein